ncbi:MAG: precorrin-6y C5,15-methyltransferase (decarboxylating) subunit CbiE [Filifactoraceae bacterium]
MIYVVGVGPSKESLLTGEAKYVIKNAHIVVATPRLFKALQHLNSQFVEMELSKIPDFIKEQDTVKDIVIVASGDVGFYSISTSIKEKLKGYELSFINGISSIQYFASILGTKYDDWEVLSLHGRKGSLIGAVSYNKKVFALTGGDIKAHTIINQIYAKGIKDIKITVGEKLSHEGQRIVKGNLEELKDMTFDDLSVILIENPNPCNRHKKLWDDDFIRGEAPMTKESVRTIAVSQLNVQPYDIVYDIGSGTGSCSIELAMKAYNSTVYALERKKEAVELLRENIKKIGSYNIECVEAYAPDGLEELPPADKVFIGGSGRELNSIVDNLIEKNPKVEILITAITLESIGEGVRVLEEKGYKPEITCVNVSKSHMLAGYHMMKAENPIYIIASGEPNGKK